MKGFLVRVARKPGGADWGEGGGKPRPSYLYRLIYVYGNEKAARDIMYVLNGSIIDL